MSGSPFLSLKAFPLSSTLSAAVAAPFAGSLATVIAVLIYANAIAYGDIGVPENAPSAVFVVARAIVIAGLEGLVISLALGLPAHYALRRLRLSHLIAYVAAGSALSIVGGWMLGFIGGVPIPIFSSSMGVAIAACFGAVAGLVFWMIRRPDLDLAPRRLAP